MTNNTKNARSTIEEYTYWDSAMNAQIIIQFTKTLLGQSFSFNCFIACFFNKDLEKDRKKVVLNFSRIEKAVPKWDRQNEHVNQAPTEISADECIELKML